MQWGGPQGRRKKKRCPDVWCHASALVVTLAFHVFLLAVSSGDVFRVWGRRPTPFPSLPLVCVYVFSTRSTEGGGGGKWKARWTDSREEGISFALSCFPTTERSPGERFAVGCGGGGWPFFVVFLSPAPTPSISSAIRLGRGGGGEGRGKWRGKEEDPPYPNATSSHVVVFFTARSKRKAKCAFAVGGGDATGCCR